MSLLVFLFCEKNKVKNTKKILLFLFCGVWVLLIIYWMLGNQKVMNWSIWDNKPEQPKENAQVDEWPVEDFVFEKGKTQNQVSAIIKGKRIIDVFSDASLVKYVDNKISFETKSYEPEWLVKLVPTECLNVRTSKPQYLRAQAKQALEKMACDFYRYFGEKIYVYSSYRSYAYQSGISEACKASGFCAREGFSEHQTGLAVDLRETTNEDKFLRKYEHYYNWLDRNAHKYGFHQSYQNGQEIDGYHIEPWHWRYLGVELATFLHDKGLTYAQYYRMKTAKN